MNSNLLAFRSSAASRRAAALDPALRTELTDAAVNSRLTHSLAKRYAPNAVAAAAFLRPIAAGYRARAAQASSDRARHWFEQHAEHIEAFLTTLRAERATLNA